MSAGDTFQQKIDKIFKDLPDILGITGDILIVRNDDESRDHDRTIR